MKRRIRNIQNAVLYRTMISGLRVAAWAARKQDMVSIAQQIDVIEDTIDLRRVESRTPIRTEAIP